MPAAGPVPKLVEELMPDPKTTNVLRIKGPVDKMMPASANRNIPGCSHGKTLNEPCLACSKISLLDAIPSYERILAGMRRELKEIEDAGI